MVIFFLTLGILLTIGAKINCDKTPESQMIQDFLNLNRLKAEKIKFLLCWSINEKAQLLQLLFKQNYSISVLKLTGDNIPMNYDDFNSLFIADLDCKDSKSILLQANNQRLFNFPHKWLLITANSTKYEQIEPEFQSLHIYPDSDILIAVKTDENQYVISEVYRYAPYRPELIRRVVYTWTEKGKFGQFNRRILAANRRDLNHTLVKSSIVMLFNDTRNHLTDYRDKHIDSITKVNYILVSHLIDYLNATTEHYFVDTWGYIDKADNSYTGMIGFLQRNEIDIGGTALFVTNDRVPVIDYVSVTTPTKIRFVFRQPPLSYQSNIFTLPFSLGLWICSFCLIVLVIVLLYFAVYLEWHQETLPQADNALNDSFMDVVMLIMSGVAQQGSNSEPRSGAGKLIMILAFISLMFLYVSYSANIVALLQSSATNIRTLEDLLESRLKCASVDTVYNRYYFETASEPVHKQFYKKKIAPPGQRPNYYELEEGVSEIRKGFFALHMELGPGYKLIGDTFYEHEKCGLQEIPFLNFGDPYLAIKKNSSYREILKIGLRKLQESGIQIAESHRIYTKKPECHTGGGSFVSVGLVDSYPAFVFLAGGFAVSVLLLLVEIIANKKGIRCNYYGNH